jgi:hypothetical protein
LNDNFEFPETPLLGDMSSAKEPDDNRERIGSSLNDNVEEKDAY